MPAGTPWGVAPKDGRARSVMVWGPRPVWDDGAQVYVHPAYGRSAPLHYSAYPYEERAWRDRKPHPDHFDDWTGYDDHFYKNELGQELDHHDRGYLHPSR